MNMDLHLLLSHADDHRPVLTEGLKLESVARELRPEPLANPESLYDHHGDLNDLLVQGWAVVVPDTDKGQRALGCVEPLIRFRATQQHLKPEGVQIYKVKPGAGLTEAEALRRKLLKLQWEDQPRYLLLLGDAGDLPFEFQQALSVDRFVGRLAFSRDEDLEAYMNKVLRAEQGEPRAEQARALFFTVHDRTIATDVGYEMLISPSLKSCRRSYERGRFPAEVKELGSPMDWEISQLLSSAAEPAPSVLLTLSHGIGAPWSGWSSSLEQRRRQGAMDLGDGRELRIEDVASKPFLPGGLWFSFSCFSAGTPARSMYAPWLKKQLQDGAGGRGPEFALSSAPVDGTSFVAALPQAALANPQGPLAVIGHVDLAWTYSVHEKIDEKTSHNHASRFTAVLGDLVRHRRAGVGLNVLSGAVASVDTKLAMLYHEDMASWAAGAEPPVEVLHRAHVWMTRHDLAGYILLGDPAVRLPIRSRPG
jgi:hypothetical protein